MIALSTKRLMGQLLLPRAILDAWRGRPRNAANANVNQDQPDLRWIGIVTSSMQHVQAFQRGK